MDENRKSQSPIAWVLGQTGDHGGQYVLSVILAIIGVAFSVAPYFVVVGIVQQGTHENLMKEEGIYRNFISERREAASWKVKRQ